MPQFKSEWVQEEYVGAYCPNYGCVVRIIEVGSETVTAQYVAHFSDGVEATKPREYKIMRRKVDRDIYGADYDPNGDGTHDYIRIMGISVALDDCMRSI